MKIHVNKIECSIPFEELKLLKPYYCEKTKDVGIRVSPTHVLLFRPHCKDVTFAAGDWSKTMWHECEIEAMTIHTVI